MLFFVSNSILTFTLYVVLVGDEICTHFYEDSFRHEVITHPLTHLRFHASYHELVGFINRKFLCELGMGQKNIPKLEPPLFLVESPLFFRHDFHAPFEELDTHNVTGPRWRLCHQLHAMWMKQLAAWPLHAGNLQPS